MVLTQVQQHVATEALWDIVGGVGNPRGQSCDTLWTRAVDTTTDSAHSQCVKQSGHRDATLSGMWEQAMVAQRRAGEPSGCATAASRCSPFGTGLSLRSPHMRGLRKYSTLQSIYAGACACSGDAATGRLIWPTKPRIQGRYKSLSPLVDLLLLSAMHQGRW